jgi:hypothetical protein
MKRTREREGGFRHRRRRSNENPADHLPSRHDLGRLKLGGDGLRLALRDMEEARKDLVPVLRCEVLRQLDDRGEAEPTIPERLDHLGELLEELGGGLPVVGRPGGQAQVAGQEREQRCVAEVDPQALSVKVRECDQELGHRGALFTEKIGKTRGFFTGGRHSRMVSRVSEAPWKARIRVLPRDLEGGSAPLPQLRVAHGAAAGAPGPAFRGDLERGNA